LPEGTLLATHTEIGHRILLEKYSGSGPHRNFPQSSIQ
jgi:hypothetical protein